MENPYPDRTVEQQVQRILRDREGLEGLVSRGNILTVPLKRETDTAPELQANAPTPQCFRDNGMGWLLPSISISSFGSIGFSSGLGSRYMDMPVSIAMYAGPLNQIGDEEVSADAMLWTIRFGVVEALEKQKVWYPGGHGSWIRVVNDVSSPVPVPEFPGSGKVMIERVRIIGVARRG